MTNANQIKISRQHATVLLRSYLHALAKEQREGFHQEGDDWNAYLWNQKVEAIEGAPGIEELIRLIDPVTADEQPEYVVLEALCSWREDTYKHVERQISIVEGPK